MTSYRLKVAFPWFAQASTAETTHSLLLEFTARRNLQAVALWQQAEVSQATSRYEEGVDMELLGAAAEANQVEHQGQPTAMPKCSTLPSVSNADLHVDAICFAVFCRHN